MTVQSIAVVLPAFNEADGLPEFLSEISQHLGVTADDLRLIVVDDHSTDSTAEAVAHLEGVRVRRQPVNRGHGPTVLQAYRLGIAERTDAVVHVDGDGQFLGADIERLLLTLESTGAEVVHGVRRGRSDPWYRQVISSTLRIVVTMAVGRRVPDVNTPLRAYRPDTLAALIAELPDDSLVPHVHLSIAEARSKLLVEYLTVQSVPRRGEDVVGTMWGRQRSSSVIPPPRLARFVAAATWELWQLSLRPRARMRDVVRLASIAALPPPTV